MAAKYDTQNHTGQLFEAAEDHAIAWQKHVEKHARVGESWLEADKRLRSEKDKEYRTLEATTGNACDVDQSSVVTEKNDMQVKANPQIEALRSLPIGEVLVSLGCHVKPDRDYQPSKNSLSQRIHASLPTGGVVELTITGKKWWDTRANLGGGGAIDLVMHLYKDSFPQAVKRLQKIVNGEVDDDLLQNQNKPSSKHLAPVRHQQCDFFVTEIFDWIPKADITSMEHPLFALKAGDKSVRVYEHNGSKVTVSPSSIHGLATMHDKDLWIYCISQLVAAKNQGCEIGRTVRFVMYDFLTSTNRPTSGVGYQRTLEALRRLKTTNIETNIVTPNYRERGGFSLIDSWRVIERSPDDNRMVAVEVDLPRWLFCSVNSMQVLTLSPDYFRLRKALDRRIYELVRKHCGQQSTWEVSVKTLHQKSGSRAAIKDFRIDIRSLANSRDLPNYLIEFDPKRDLVIFKAKTL